METLIEEYGGSIIMLLFGAGAVAVLEQILRFYKEGEMKAVFREYGGMLIASAATCTFLVLIGNIFLAQDGLLSKLIMAWGNGGI